MGFVGILHDIGKMFSFVKLRHGRALYTEIIQFSEVLRGGRRRSVRMFVMELAESVHKIPIRRNGRAYSLGNAPLSPSAHAWTFPRLIKQTSPQGRTGGDRWTRQAHTNCVKVQKTARPAAHVGVCGRDPSAGASIKSDVF